MTFGALAAATLAAAAVSAAALAAAAAACPRTSLRLDCVRRWKEHRI